MYRGRPVQRRTCIEKGVNRGGPVTRIMARKACFGLDYAISISISILVSLLYIYIRVILFIFNKLRWSYTLKKILKCLFKYDEERSVVCDEL